MRVTIARFQSIRTFSHCADKTLFDSIASFLSMSDLASDNALTEVGNSITLP
jgi:hypothetical protein